MNAYDWIMFVFHTFHMHAIFKKKSFCQIQFYFYLIILGRRDIEIKTFKNDITKLLSFDVFNQLELIQQFCRVIIDCR